MARVSDPSDTSDIRVRKCPTCRYPVSRWALACPNCFTPKPGGGGESIGPVVRITVEEGEAELRARGIEPQEHPCDPDEFSYETLNLTEEEADAISRAQAEAVDEHLPDEFRTIKYALIAATGVGIAAVLLPLGWTLVIGAGFAGAGYLAASLQVLK